MLRTAFVLLFVLAAAGCDSGLGSAQRQFEDQALLSRPAGFTEIEIVNGAERVVSEDLDDWRLGPAFGVNTQMVQRPIPNPVNSNQEVTLTLFTDGLVGGMVLSRLTARGDLERIEFAPRATERGFYSFTFNGSRIWDGLPGLYRVVVEDGRGRIVTYGDVLVLE